MNVVINGKGQSFSPFIYSPQINIQKEQMRFIFFNFTLVHLMIHSRLDLGTLTGPFPFIFTFTR